MENNNQSDQIKSEDNFSMPVDPNINASLVGGLKERIDDQNSKARHPKGRTGLFIFIVILFVILGVGGWWYYAQGQVILLNQQMKLDLTQIGGNNQSEVSLDAKIKSIGQDNGFLGQNITISGKGSQYTQDNDFDGEISFKFTDDKDILIDLDIFARKLAEKLYLKLEVAGLEKLGLPISINLGDEWIVFDSESMDNSFVPSQMSAKNIIPTEEAKKRIQDLFEDLKSSRAFKISDPHKTMDSNGQTLRKIKYNIKESKLKDLILIYIKFYSEITSASIEESGLSEGKSSEDINKIKQEAIDSFLKFTNEKPDEWEKFKKSFAALDIYLWVNTNTKNIQGLDLSVDNLEILDKENKGYNITLDYKLILFSVEDREIALPTNIQSIEEFMGNILGGMMGGLGSTKTVDGYDGPLITPDNPEWSNNHTLDKIDSDSDGLSDAMEGFYGTDENNPDSDGDGYLDGEEIDNGFNPMGEGELYVKDPLGVNIEQQFPLGLQELCITTGGQLFLADEQNQAMCNILDIDDCENNRACASAAWGASCIAINDCWCPEGMDFLFNGCQFLEEDL